ncbi:hypothetical protein Efla_002895 [Eimeria flavescens]
MGLHRTCYHVLRPSSSFGLRNDTYSVAAVWKPVPRGVSLPQQCHRGTGHQWTWQKQQRPYHIASSGEESLRSAGDSGRQTDRLQRILQSAGLESYAACKDAWAYLGAMGALKLIRGQRTEELYGRSPVRLVFMVTHPEVVQAWTEAIEHAHAKQHPLLLAFDLEWASFLENSIRRGGISNESTEEKEGASGNGNAATSIREQSSARSHPDGLQLSLMQLCVEKQGRRDAWPPPGSLPVASPTLKTPFSNPAYPVAATGPSPRRTPTEKFEVFRTGLPKGTSASDISVAVTAALEIGSVCLFDLSTASKSSMGHLRRLLENPTMPKVVHDCREDSAILFAQFGVKLRGVFDSMVAAQVLQRSRRVEVFQQSLNDLLLERLGVVNPRKEQASRLLRDDPTLWLSRPLPRVLTEYAVYDVLHLLALSRALRLSMTDAQELECFKWSTLYADYCHLNRKSDACVPGEAKCRKFFKISGNSSGETCSLDTQCVSQASSDACSSSANLAKARKYLGTDGTAGFAKVSVAPGATIRGLVAAVGSRRVLLKLNLGDPRIVALADCAQASACLNRSPRVGDTLCLLVRGRDQRTGALFVNVLPQKEDDAQQVRLPRAISDERRYT